MRLEKANGLLESLGRARCKQYPRRRVAAVGNGAERSGALRVIGRDHRLESATLAQGNHRAPGRIGLQGDNTKVLLGRKDHRPTRRIVLAQFLIRAPAEEFNVRTS